MVHTLVTVYVHEPAKFNTHIKLVDHFLSEILNRKRCFSQLECFIKDVNWVQNGEFLICLSL